jgi:hypothetical protein
MIIDFQTAQTSKKAEKKLRYIITIDEQETPLYTSKELKKGVITVMITARTPEEADILRKQSTAILRTVMA